MATKPIGRPRKEVERERARAYLTQLKKDGSRRYSNTRIAGILGVSVTAVGIWLREFEAERAGES